MFYRFRDRKRWREFLGFAKQVRRRFPTGSDYPSHTAQETAIARYIRWANRHATPRRRLAVNSKIRRPDYLPNLA